MYALSFEDRKPKDCDGAELYAIYGSSEGKLTAVDAAIHGNAISSKLPTLNQLEAHIEKNHRLGFRLNQSFLAQYLAPERNGAGSF